MATCQMVCYREHVLLRLALKFMMQEREDTI